MKNVKKTILSIIVTFAMTAGTYIYSSNVTTGVYCKDCGSEANCWQGNGFDTGYQSCQVEYDENGNAVGCEVDTAGYGDGCEPYTGPLIYPD